MLDPLALTFECLATTENGHALDILIPALDSDQPRVRTLATTALLRRRSTRGHMELVRRLERLAPEMRSAVARHSAGLETSLRQCLMHGDAELRTNALSIVAWIHDYNHMPGLLNLLEDRNNLQKQAVVEVIRELIAHLYDQLHHTSEGTAASAPVRDAERIRDQVIAALENSCNRFETHGCEVVLESLLALAGIEHFALKKLLRQPGHPLREFAERLLLTSTHPGVMSKVTDFMGLNYPPAIALQAIQHRSDPEFIAHLLRWLPRRLSPAQQLNYKQITSLTWLQEPASHLELIPPALQKRLVTFVRQTGITARDQRTAIDWIVKFGVPEARQAATDVLSSAHDDAVQEIVIGGLSSEEPEVQAWATTQLRARGVPQAFSLLIERLDSPLPEVRDAARAELGDFNLKRVLELYDHLEPTTCILAGKLMQKIDPDSLHQLRLEMTNTMRTKRIRAVQAAVAIGVQKQVAGTLIELLQDEDAVVRRTAIEILGTVPAPEVLQALQPALDDPSPRVRAAAEHSVQQITASLEGDLDAVAAHRQH